MKDVLLVALIIGAAVVFGHLTRGVKSFIGRRFLSIVFMVVLALIAEKCGLL